MALIIKLLADGVLVPIILIAGYELIWKVSNRRRYDIYTHIIMAGLTSYVLAKISGSLYQPEKMRPFEQLGTQAGAAYLNNPGFPSDHALFAMFLVLAVWYATRNKRVASILFLLTIMMCVGRVLALVHTPLDVVGGVVIACVGAIWYINSNKITHISSKNRKNVVK